MDPAYSCAFSAAAAARRTVGQTAAHPLKQTGLRRSSIQPDITENRADNISFGMPECCDRNTRASSLKIQRPGDDLGGNVHTNVRRRIATIRPRQLAKQEDNVIQFGKFTTQGEDTPFPGFNLK